MNWNNITYQKKNKYLIICAVLLLLLCWILSYSKTWEAYTTNKKLTNQLVLNHSSEQYANRAQQKHKEINNLLMNYSKDSVTFKEILLANISIAIQGLPVQLIYDEQINKETQQSNTQSKSFILQGNYKSIIKAIQKLEKDFFISRLKYDKGNYWMEIGG